MSGPSSSSPSLAVVTVSYGSQDSLAAMLPSIDRATSEPVDLVVVDNLPDGQVEPIARAAGARYLPLENNSGYGGGINAGVAVLSDDVEWILVVNPDVEFSAGSIDALRRTGESDPRIGAVGPAVRTSDGSLYPSAREVPSIRIGVGHALFASTWSNNPWTRRYWQDEHPETRDAGWLSGSCVLVRRTAFDALGGFDEGFFMYFEDVDLGMRMGRAGWRNVYEPDAEVTHTGAHSTANERSAMIGAHHRSAARFLRKKYPGRRWDPVHLLLRAGLSARLLVIRLRSRG